MKTILNITIIISCVLIACTVTTSAQEQSSSITVPNPLTFSGYVETYYSYDFGNPANHERPSFFYCYNRHNEVNLHIGLIKAKYAKDNVRGTLSLMVGTYPQYNLAGEQGLLKNVYEADAGVKIFDNTTSTVWIDAGIMPSHIGFESTHGQDCWNLTRSILAENTPFYEAGVKVGYSTSDDKFYASAMYLNGWQRIQRIANNQTPAFGTQITYKPDNTITLNWSTYIGNEQPDSVALMRFFNNFYGIFQISENFGLTAGFDIGFQKKTPDSSAMNLWYSPVVILQYKITNSLNIAARAEYYADENGVIIPTGTLNGFQTMGLSVNLDYWLGTNRNVLFRVEARTLSSKDEIFLSDNNPSKQNSFFTTSMSILF
ncbi:MAG: porin [Ignavibacteriae bacterium]|nr:porin [Ignavibacteriota bacterium]